MAQIAAASVRTTGVPTAASAPYMLECESDATTRLPGWTNPFSTISWWPMPAPAGWKTIPCSRAKASIAWYLARLPAELSWTLWSSVNTGWAGSATRVAPIDRNLDSTALVLSCVITWRGRIVTMSPARTSWPDARSTA